MKKLVNIFNYSMNRLRKVPFLFSAVVFVYVLSVSMTNNSDKLDEIEMVFIEGGTVVIDERPIVTYCTKVVHDISPTISSFYIGKYEITQKQWMAVMGNNPSIHPKGDNYPIDNVSWDDVQEFIEKLNKLTGKNYRLPTEMEWKYAAHGGKESKGYKYSGSNNIHDVAWFNDNSSESTHPVGTKLPNELGIYDMTGNVREWTSESLFLDSPGLGGAKLVFYRLLLGSGWHNGRCGDYSENLVAEPHDRKSVFGFRLVLPVD